MWWNACVVGICLLGAACIVGGCSEFRNTMKHVESSFTGLSRKITLYAVDGKVIREWETTSKVEDQGGTVYFLDKNGKAITVSGTFVVEEK